MKTVQDKNDPELTVPPTLTGEHVLIRALVPDDAGEAYARWMNDPCVVMYTEARFSSYDQDDLRRYIRDVLSDPLSHMWAICDLDTRVHIGNIKLGPVNLRHSFGDIGLIIGERSAWGHGVATEAISLVCKFAFQQLRLHKVTASMYEENAGSRRAFEKAGFTTEGVRTSQYLLDDHYTGLVMMGRTSGDTN
ncbi:MAG: GNAT family N-acetyltransferase [Chloroflexi bacterium]|nr:GNAT family N-acetyltransferase [Chloroflexota bacterium]